MTELSPEQLIFAVRRLLAQIGKLSAEEDDVSPQKLEQSARALCSQLKAIQELEAHNLRQVQSQTDEKYTRYEDLPPPSPAEQDRFYARLKSAIHRLETGS